MGYTHYFSVNEKLPAKKWSGFIRDCRSLFEGATIKVRIGKKRIEIECCEETFILNDSRRYWHKTNRQEGDDYVTAFLLLMKHHWGKAFNFSSDGSRFQGKNTYEEHDAELIAGYNLFKGKFPAYDTGNLDDYLEHGKRLG